MRRLERAVLGAPLPCARIDTLTLKFARSSTVANAFLKFFVPQLRARDPNMRFQAMRYKERTDVSNVGGIYDIIDKISSLNPSSTGAGTNSTTDESGDISTNDQIDSEAEGSSTSADCIEEERMLKFQKLKYAMDPELPPSTLEVL